MKDRRSLLLGAFVLFCSACAFAQELGESPKAQTLPSAPVPQVEQPFVAPKISTLVAAAQTASPSPYPPGSASSPQSASPAQLPPSGTTQLTLKDAEALAIKNNPQISVARLLSLASEQTAREARSNLWPTATGSVTGVDAVSGTRLSAGLLNSPILYERVGVGVMVSQLITDFGRTNSLISSANLAAKAENENAVATKQQILLAVNRAFYNALQAQALLTVAQQTVKERQTIADQVGLLYKSKLKSELDFSFASVNLAQAQLLLLDAQNNQDATMATLSMVLGYPNVKTYQLVNDGGEATPPPGNVDDLVSQAFSVRPEIRSLKYQYESDRKFQKAERDLLFPTIRATGVVGITPAGNSAVAPSPNGWNNNYGAVGANMDVPLFNGFLYFARAKEASLRADATDERLRDMQNLVARDVRTSWLNANTAFQRLAVTQQLLDQAKLALDLAQSRYKLGLGSIVELSQAQLQETQAQISFAQAGYDYRLSLAVLTYETTGI